MSPPAAIGGATQRYWNCVYQWGAMRIGSQSSSWALSLMLVSLLVVTTESVVAGAGRTRPGGSSGGAGGGHRVSGGARVSGGYHGSGAHRVPGRATYGYGHGHGSGYYPGYGWGWGGYYGYRWGYGYPYYGYGGRPYYRGVGYAARPVILAGGQAGASRPGGLELNVKPKKASVTVDGKYVGQARDFNGKWDLLWLKPGGRVVELGYDGHKTLRLFLEVEGGQFLKLGERLEKGEGIDPRSTEQPPYVAEVDERLPPPEEVPPPSVQPAPSLRRCLLRLNVRPPDAAVYLDGEFLASAAELNRLHGAIPVAQGIHSLEVVRPGFASQARDVEVGGEEPVSVEIDLDRTE